jgi:hypothetical protein
MIYGYSWYLNQMADNWGGLVVNNYEAVMPLPWKKKYGVYYIYQPFLTAQLGLFGNIPDGNLLRKCLKSIPSRFRLIELPLNYDNDFPVKGFGIYQRKNYVLELSFPYEVLKKNYRDNNTRNIKKSEGYGSTVQKGIALNLVIDLAREAGQIAANESEKLIRLSEILEKKNSIKSYGICSKNQELLASCIFTFSHNRAYYILVGNHPNGRTLGASHALIDAFIKDHAGQNLLLDFEGSDLRNLAFFYSGFGAREEIYPAIKLNRLPWWMRWLKK